MSQGSFVALKMCSKMVPNRITDAEGVRKPLDRHFGRYHSALRGISDALGRILRACGGLLERLADILSALGAILAEHVAWNLH